MPETQFDWHNGVITERPKTKVDQLNLGAYGIMAWEGIKAYDGVPFRGKEHFERLQKSCHHLGENVRFSVAELLQGTRDLLQANKFGKGSYYIRPQVIFGDGQIGIGSTGNQHVIIRAVEYSNTQKDMRLVVTPQVRKVLMPNPDKPDLHHKVPSNYRFARETGKIAKEAGFDDGINLDANGNISESSVTNIFFIDTENKKIHTPKQGYIFPGITRGIIIEILGPKLGYEVVERDIKPEEIESFDECFLCGTASEISTVKSIALNRDEKQFVSTSSSLEFAQAYSQLISSENTSN